MPKLPRFEDEKGKYDVSLCCPKCGWAIIKDSITKSCTKCLACGSKSVTRKYYYPPLVSKVAHDQT